MRKLNDRELGTVLAALRQRQTSIANGEPHQFEDIATDDNEFVALDAYEIDQLCERLNV